MCMFKRMLKYGVVCEVEKTYLNFKTAMVVADGRRDEGAALRQPSPCSPRESSRDRGRVSVTEV